MQGKVWLPTVGLIAFLSLVMGCTPQSQSQLATAVAQAQTLQAMATQAGTAVVMVSQAASLPQTAQAFVDQLGRPSETPAPSTTNESIGVLAEVSETSADPAAVIAVNIHWTDAARADRYLAANSGQRRQVAAPVSAVVPRDHATAGRRRRRCESPAVPVALV